MSYCGRKVKVTEVQKEGCDLSRGREGGLYSRTERNDSCHGGRETESGPR